MNPVEPRQDLNLLGFCLGTATGLDKIDDDLTFIWYEFEPVKGLFGEKDYSGRLVDLSVDFHTGEYWLDDDRGTVLEHGHLAELTLHTEDAIEKFYEVFGSFGKQQQDTAEKPNKDDPWDRVMENLGRDSH